jgi:endonuclease/exonuclease/phosphatase family metal-dependent hydrolase
LSDTARSDGTPLARLASDHFPLVCELTLKLNNELSGTS